MDSIYVDVLLFVRHLLGTRRYRRSQAHSEHQPFLSCGGFCLLRHFFHDEFAGKPAHIEFKILQTKRNTIQTRNSKRGFSRGFQHVAGRNMRNFLQHRRSRLHGRLVGNFFSVWHFGKSHGSHSSIHALFRQSYTKNKENAALQKKYLKLQLDPHFVYNSLGALAGMIELEPKTAEEYLVKFSRVYGYLLRHIEIDYIDIGEAADFVAVYVDMLNKRYHGNIILQNEINAETDQGFILALSLQLLIENAVKHNYPQEDQKLYIRIYVRDKMLVVRNNRIYNGCRNDQNVESYGIGIRNLCRRYELECGTQPEFQATTDAFEARLPVLPKKQDI